MIVMRVSSIQPKEVFMVSPRVGLILSGCGFKDGSEIHETVLAMLALEEAGAKVEAFAPDILQQSAINHLNGAKESTERHVLVESARIARGAIRPLSSARAVDLDAVVIPGGFGAATNLCDFAARGADMVVNPQLAELLLDMHAAHKPIGAICIAPVILAKVFGRLGCRITIGFDKDTALTLQKLGAQHVEASAEEIVVDSNLRLVTTPAYMLGHSVKEIHQGIRKLATEVVRLAQRR
jgi:enhancing lycopene biosynthesis protein 2